MTDHKKPRKTSPLDQIMPSFTFGDMKARANHLANSTVITQEEMHEFRVLRNWIARMDGYSDDATFILDDARVLDGGKPVKIFDIPYRLYPNAIPTLQVNKSISLSARERTLVAEAIENLIEQVNSEEEERILTSVLERLRGPVNSFERETSAPAYPFPGAGNP
ncbi:hypothetical protein J2857_006153 [Neorhizobium galegae]|uniref:hypothetical protein n=1 Tax=Neorhizobium galegae TaxID=399 RepID=UPI001AEB9BA7|nr:hypothetical protein [Neorhizobium galegae]MBP2563354.1 hypothetical protein [Neorhizobium galegae]